VHDAEEKAQSIAERIGDLDEDIALEQKLLGMAQKKADNAHEAQAAMAESLRTRSVAGAPQEELQGLAQAAREAEQRALAARAEVRQHSGRLDELQTERAGLLAQQVAARDKARAEERRLAEVQGRVRELDNPFAPRNVLHWLIDHGPKMLATVLAMLIFSWLAHFFSHRIVSLVARGGFRGSKEEREARARTLVGVFHNAATVLIVAGGTLMLLQEAGIPIAPLLGGAAVFGLAVAFGAQNLIRDYFYGFVILLENQYKINDVVKIGSLSGSVERITLRMTVLRDLEGCVHFLPNGGISSVTNMTHGWSRAVFEISVAYKEDIDRVMGLMVELGKEMREDATYAPMILDDLTMLGVDSLADSAVMVKFFIKTRPLQQWAVKRELLRRIKNRFDALGIEIPFPQRVVHHRLEEGVAKPPSPPPSPSVGSGLHPFWTVLTPDNRPETRSQRR
jgi:small conductance mechanosensitive channel